MIDLNLRSVCLLSQAAAPHVFPAAGRHRQHLVRGRRVGLPYVAPYGAAKAGVNNLTRSSRPASAPGIRVNCIAVGPVSPRDSSGRCAPDGIPIRSAAATPSGAPDSPRRSPARSCSWCRRPPFLSGETIYFGGPAVPKYAYEINWWSSSELRGAPKRAVATA